MGGEDEEAECTQVSAAQRRQHATEVLLCTKGQGRPAEACRALRVPRAPLSSTASGRRVIDPIENPNGAGGRGGWCQVGSGCSLLEAGRSATAFHSQP